MRHKPHLSAVVLCVEILFTLMAHPESPRVNIGGERHPARLSLLALQCAGSC